VERDLLAVVCGNQQGELDKLRAALGPRLTEVHEAFGGQRGLGAVRLILRDVCGGDAQKLKQLIEALD